MKKVLKTKTNLTDQEGKQLTTITSGTKVLEQPTRAMSLSNVFDQDPLGAAAGLFQKQMITGHNLKVALLTLVTILSAKLQKAMGLLLAATDPTAGMRILKQCLLLAPENAYRECGQLKNEELFGNAAGIDGRAIVSFEPLGLTKAWAHLEKLLTVGHSIHTEVIKSKYDTFAHSHRAAALVSVVGIIADMKDRSYDNPAILKVPLNINEYPVSQLLGPFQDGRQVDVSTEVATVRLRETLARFRPTPVEIPFASVLLDAVKAADPSDLERKMEIILKTLAICCIVNNPEQATQEEIFARIYKIDIHKLRQLQAASAGNQYIPEEPPVIRATKVDYYHAWLLLNDMIPVNNISLSDRQCRVYEALKQYNIYKMSNVMSKPNAIKQISLLSGSTAYWATRENIFEALNKTDKEEISLSTLYHELQHLMKEGLVAEGKYPKSSQKGYYVTTFEAGKKIQLPHPSVIIDDMLKGEKVQVINPITGGTETI